MQGNLDEGMKKWIQGKKKNNAKESGNDRKKIRINQLKKIKYTLLYKYVPNYTQYTYTKSKYTYLLVHLYMYSTIHVNTFNNTQLAVFQRITSEFLSKYFIINFPCC